MLVLDESDDAAKDALLMVLLGHDKSFFGVRGDVRYRTARGAHCGGTMGLIIGPVRVIKPKFSVLFV